MRIIHFPRQKETLVNRRTVPSASQAHPQPDHSSFKMTQSSVRPRRPSWWGRSACPCASASAAKAFRRSRADRIWYFQYAEGLLGLEEAGGPPTRERRLLRMVSAMQPTATLKTRRDRSKVIAKEYWTCASWAAVRIYVPRLQYTVYREAVLNGSLKAYWISNVSHKPRVILSWDNEELQNVTLSECSFASVDMRNGKQDKSCWTMEVSYLARCGIVVYATCSLFLDPTRK